MTKHELSNGIKMCGYLMAIQRLRQMSNYSTMGVETAPLWTREQQEAFRHLRWSAFSLATTSRQLWKDYMYLTSLDTQDFFHLLSRPFEPDETMTCINWVMDSYSEKLCH